MGMLPHERHVRRRRRRNGIHEATDDALVAGMAARDDNAAEAFVRRHQRRVFGIALAITAERALAEEISQEAFLRAWRHASVFDPRRSSAVSWLSTITRNLAIDALRLRRASPVDPADAIWLGLGDAEPGPATRAERSDVADRVRAALLTVPTDQRRALVRSAVYGQTAAEVAEAESVPLGTAKSRIRLGLSKVRLALEEDGR
jgi:RNA polymerase sigma factor (sigma-70 family)